jgi:hypothetical protein
MWLLFLAALFVAGKSLIPRRAANMLRGLPRGSARQGSRGGITPRSQGAGSCPARALARQSIRRNLEEDNDQTEGHSGPASA